MRFAGSDRAYLRGPYWDWLHLPPLGLYWAEEEAVRILQMDDASGRRERCAGLVSGHGGLPGSKAKGGTSGMGLGFEEARFPRRRARAAARRMRCLGGLRRHGAVLDSRQLGSRRPSTRTQIARAAREHVRAKL